MSTCLRKVPISKPSLGEEEAAAARRAILSGWVTQGPEVQAFEEEFAAYVGAPHACAVSSCTTALHLALHALGVGPGDEVVTVSHSFIATANAVRHCGARPVFVDIDPRTYNMDPALIEAAITPRTRAIMPVHQVGLPCDMGAVLAVAERHGLPVVEDAACAIGSELRVGQSWCRVGRPHGTVACFSFHPRKVITTGDGGMLTTRDPALDRTFRLLRQHGMSVPDTARHASLTVVFEDYPVVGFNYRMTDIQAAVGREQLRRLPGILDRRVALAEAYTRALREVPGMEPPHVPTYGRPNYQSYAVRVTPAFPLGRDALMQALLDQGVSTRRGIMNAHQEGAYPGQSTAPLPHSEAARDDVILLPLFDAMTGDDQSYVIEAVYETAAAAGARRAR
jgi:dTDP-4-amino-4,6-dideoxygalactose transaminase